MTYCAPTNDEECDPKRWSHQLKHDIAGHFKEGVWNEEDLFTGQANCRSPMPPRSNGEAEACRKTVTYRERHVVLSWGDTQVIIHASNSSISDVAAIDVAKEVQDC